MAAALAEETTLETLPLHQAPPPVFTPEAEAYLGRVLEDWFYAHPLNLEGADHAE